MAIDLTKYGITGTTKSCIILLMSFSLRKKQNPNWRVMKKDR